MTPLLGIKLIKPAMSEANRITRGSISRGGNYATAALALWRASLTGLLLNDQLILLKGMKNIDYAVVLESVCDIHSKCRRAGFKESPHP